MTEEKKEILLTRDFAYFQENPSYLENYDEVVPIDDDYYVILTKPKMTTNFCLEYIHYLKQDYISWDKNYEITTENIEINVDFFITENLRQYENVEQFTKEAEVFTLMYYENEPLNHALITRPRKHVENQYEKFGKEPIFEEKIYRDMNKADVEKILSMVSEAKERFTIKLKEYWEEYGSSKVKAYRKITKEV